VRLPLRQRPLYRRSALRSHRAPCLQRRARRTGRQRRQLLLLLPPLRLCRRGL
jgi:hypothetical protein